MKESAAGGKPDGAAAGVRASGKVRWNASPNSSAGNSRRPMRPPPGGPLACSFLRPTIPSPGTPAPTPPCGARDGRPVPAKTPLSVSSAKAQSSQAPPSHWATCWPPKWTAPASPSRATAPVSPYPGNWSRNMSHRYRVTVLTPLLAGSGELLSPIDYMVWQSEVRVLDQDRIFKLLARSPRLEAYLDQLRKSERLDWAQWGGYAQSYSSALVPFASAGLAGIWEKARNEDLYIPRFAHGGGRRLLPGSAIKGAFRTAWLGGALPPENAAGLWKDCMAHSDRWFTASAVEAASRRRVTDQLSFGDARTPADNFRIYQTRSLVLRSESKTPSAWKPGQQVAE